MNRLPHAKISAQDVASYLQNLSIELKHTQLLEVVARSRGFKNYHVMKNHEQSSSNTLVDKMNEKLISRCTKSGIDIQKFIQWLDSDTLNQLFTLFEKKDEQTFLINEQQFDILNQSTARLNSLGRRIEGEHKNDIRTASRSIRDVLIAIEHPPGIPRPVYFMSDIHKAPEHENYLSGDTLGENDAIDDDSLMISSEEQEEIIKQFLDTTHDSKYFVMNGRQLWDLLLTYADFSKANCFQQSYEFHLNHESGEMEFISQSKTANQTFFNLSEEDFLNATYLNDGQWLIAHHGVMTFGNGKDYIVSSPLVVVENGQDEKPYAVIHDNGLAYEDITDLEQAQNTARMLAENETGTLAYVEDVLGRCVYMFVDGFVPVKRKIDSRKKLF